MSVTVYGIPNCGSVKKALATLKALGVPHTFVDFKKSGVSESLLNQWLEQHPLEVLINRKGSTWRMLSEADKALADERQTALPLLIANPSLIKRPIVDRNGSISVGQTDFN